MCSLDKERDMRHFFKAFLFSGGILLLPALSLAQKIQVDYAHGEDFSKYKTYTWVKEPNVESPNQLVEQRIVSSVDETLAKKGLKRVDNGGDLDVAYQSSVTQKTQLTTMSSGMGGGWGPGPGWGRGWGGGMGGMSSGISTTTSSTIPVGTLVIDLLDPNAKLLVFRGIATDTLSSKPEANTKKIVKAVDKIFEKYPPKEKG
jgi:Domain of unknown function (DUF4136)